MGIQTPPSLRVGFRFTLHGHKIVVGSPRLILSYNQSQPCIYLYIWEYRLHLCVTPPFWQINLVVTRGWWEQTSSFLISRSIAPWISARIIAHEDLAAPLVTVYHKMHNPVRTKSLHVWWDSPDSYIQAIDIKYVTIPVPLMQIQHLIWKLCVQRMDLIGCTHRSRDKNPMLVQGLGIPRLIFLTRILLNA